jgi:hypothetical protein
MQRRPICIGAASTSSLCTPPDRCEVRMLESRLILNVTVFTPEPLDDFPNGHALEDGVIAPEVLTLLPGR